MFRGSDNSGDTSLFISNDYGLSFKNVTVPSKVFSYIVPNMWKSKYLLGQAGHSAYLSKDFGETWSLVFNNQLVRSIMWDPLQNAQGSSQTAIFAILQKEKMQFVYSEDFGKTFNMLVNGAQDMTFTDSFIYVGAYDQALGGSNLFVRNNIQPANTKLQGFVMCDFPFGDDIQPNEYKIIDDSSGAIWLGIQMKRADRFGSVYVSDSSGGKFTLSKERISLMSEYDFAPFYGLKGAYVANQVTTGTNIQTIVTYDNGGKWSNFDPPTDSRPQKGSSLNFYGISTYLDVKKQYGPFYSTENAIGISIATGTVGKSLSFDTPAAKIKTFISRDGGKNWVSVYDGPTIYEIGNRGTIILLANCSDETNQLSYSLHQGRKDSFMDLKLSETSYDIKNIMTDPDSASTKFVVMAYDNDANQGLIFGVDFTSLRLPECSDDDHENFTTPSILGHTTTFTRVKQDSECFQTKELPGQSTQMLNCTTDDYECDIGYVQASPDGADKLVCALQKDFTQPSYPPEWCPPGSQYYITKGYRKIASDLCIEGVSSQYEPTWVNCGGSPSSGSSSHGWVAALVILLALAIGIVGGAFYLHRNPDVKLNFYRKVGIIKEFKYSTLGIRPNSLADDEFGIEDDDAHIINDDDLRLDDEF
ncbi:hypothetical protein SAMD00019534_058490 [Acytostelium subglobosum LB1]|uniref:hypothetical protein n=1 Tax=Acytostelium subglobosum LB1 TaxID=1410327 RepID=UPI0006451EA9|nr:hypothetical protein SAMD00019534_058490 [Acytostelium subglobosum LB1]GAM22674.1 hypothetical protein SAMD00019534_058490 [Acytostelium subglobosum LB1]|eukprot:XP_012754794.1 hypothetical protein SAMD00019534_058490 [Acytostelium subglobosum LB1]